MTGIQAAIEPFLYDSLLPYQRECVSYVINRCNGRALIADDMYAYILHHHSMLNDCTIRGLGKTVQAIAIASYYRSEWPALIVCPSSVRLTWCEALHHWLPSLRKSEVNVVYECKDSLAGSAITIISYDIAVKKHEELRRKNYQIIIAVCATRQVSNC
jgi:SWI/SNF-related matrix-associated actin-dependent regulator 1 of chromatin subfamily A